MTLKRLSEDEVFDESKTDVQGDMKQNVVDSVTDDVVDGVITLHATEQSKPETKIYNVADSITKEPSPKIKKNHPVEEIIGGIYDGIRTRDKLKQNY